LQKGHKFPVIPFTVITPPDRDWETNKTLKQRQTEWDEKYDGPNSEHVKSMPARPSEELDNFADEVQKSNTKVFNACAQLNVEPIYSQLRKQGLCGLEAIMALQKDIQENVYKHDFESLQDDNALLRAFYDWNDRALDSEKEELLASLGGMSTGMGDGTFWKPWKKKHNELMHDFCWNDLSEADKFEAWFEWVDAMHFMLNKALAIGMTPQIIVDFYFAKNKENRERQQRGY